MKQPTTLPELKVIVRNFHPGKHLSLGQSHLAKARGKLSALMAAPDQAAP